MECLKFVAMVWLAILAGAGIMFAATVVICAMADWVRSIYDQAEERKER